jgi:hypothetical protein
MALLDEFRAELIARGGVGRLFEARGLTLEAALDSLAAELRPDAPWKVRQQARRDLLAYLGAQAGEDRRPGEIGAAGGFDAVLVAYWQSREALPAGEDHEPPGKLEELPSRERALLPARARALAQGRIKALEAYKAARPGRQAGPTGQAGGQAGGPHPHPPVPSETPAMMEQVPESRSIPPLPSYPGGSGGGEG